MGFDACPYVDEGDGAVALNSDPSVIANALHDGTNCGRVARVLFVCLSRCLQQIRPPGQRSALCGDVSRTAERAVQFSSFSSRWPYIIRRALSHCPVDAHSVRVLTRSV